jgi:hypothetical protein
LAWISPGRSSLTAGRASVVVVMTSAWAASGLPRSQR